MKIGILSLVLHSNYGGILQSYALQTILERMGHEVVVLTKDRRIKVGLLRQLHSSFHAFMVNHSHKSGKIAKNYWQLEKERKIIEQYTSLFISKYINTRTLQKLDNDALEGLDAVVVGSDQVWRTIYFKDQWNTCIEDAFLKFAEGKPIKRVSYAASFGTDGWEYTEQETKECARLLGLFDAVSVREKAGIHLCKEKLMREDVIQVLDPTLLLNKEDYVDLVRVSNVNAPSGDLMCYVLNMDDEKQNLIRRVANERKLTPFYVNSKYEDGRALLGERVQPPVEQWLRGFMDAKFVITDSFHACVFSIVFEKPFVVIANEHRGVSRYVSLLEKFNIMNHLIRKLSDYNSEYEYNIPIQSFDRLSELKEKSVKFLENSLNIL